MDAEDQLPELLQRVEAGDEVIITRHGIPVARLVPVNPISEITARRMLLASVRSTARTKATPGETAARSQDFLYNDDGLPG